MNVPSAEFPACVTVPQRRGSTWVEAAQRRRTCARFPLRRLEQQVRKPWMRSFVGLIADLVEHTVQAAGFGLLLGLFLMVIYLLA